MTNHWIGVALALAIQPLAHASTLGLDASAVFEQSVTQNLRLSEDSSAIEIQPGELFEDDGPAAGHSYQKPNNREKLSTRVWIKKDLIIPDPRAQAAYLVVLSDEPFDCMINGRPQKLGPNQSGRSSYQTCAIDPKALKAGRNEVVLRNSGHVLIARADEFSLGSPARTKHPNRSARSVDGGRNWDYDHLGPDGKLDGEYGVRIFLEHYPGGGSITMPVLDAGNLQDRTIPPVVEETGPIRVAVEADLGAAGEIVVRARTGATYIPNDKSWSPWAALSPTGGRLERPSGRYVQIAVELSTRDPLQTPKLKSLRLEAAAGSKGDWTDRIRVLEEHNETIVRTSIPFAYEPLNQPQLKTLREEHKLDDVIRGAKGELELMLRLAQWACNAWDWPNHITEGYPSWDAVEILKPHADGTPVGGFCQQFNLVFVQACESYGIPGRAISISQGSWQERYPGGGHEIVELWSNEWNKWVYVDGALAWYIVDDKSGIPLSIWELRQRQLATVRGETVQPVRVVEAERTRNKQFRWKGLGGPEPLNWYLELRMIPRSNFLEEKYPLPLNQGTEEWAWTGHYVWTDAAVPAGLLFGHRVNRRSDFEWTLNQAHYVLEPGVGAGRLRVHLDTETPSFDTFLAQIDGGEKKPVASGFLWLLHPGRNEFRVVPRNIAGREGIPSWITLEYKR